MVEDDLVVAVTAQPIQHPSVLQHAIDAVEQRVDELMEGLGGEQAVRAGLVLRPYPLHVQRLCQLVEAAMQIPAELHQVLDVVHVGKVDLRTGPHLAVKLGNALQADQPNNCTRHPASQHGPQSTLSDGVAQRED